LRYQKKNPIKNEGIGEWVGEMGKYRAKVIMN
jgi:hypothetical protein